jgi:hypothetical protein
MGKLKEVDNQTHQLFERKNPNQLTKGTIDIFERHPTFKTLILGINPQLRRAQRRIKKY